MRNDYAKHVFPGFYSIHKPPTHQTTDPPPLNHWLIDQQPPTQRLAESIIILERLGNRNKFILQNTIRAGKTFNYALVYYPKSLLVYIKHIRSGKLYSFF